MDGFRVMPMAQAAPLGDIFVTATGDLNVVSGEHFQVMKDGAVVANTGHFNVEIDIPALETLATSHRPVRDFVEEYRMADGRGINLLAEGRLINLAAAEGHPASVMDMSFANQALSLEYLVGEGRGLAPQVYDVPQTIDQQVAQLKLGALRVGIDELTPEQVEYLKGWQQGT